MSLPRRTTLAIAIAALLVQGCVLIAVTLRTGKPDGYAFASLDAKEYYRLAVNLAHHGTFSQAENAPFAPDTWRTPGYPLFLAACLLLVGDSPLALLLVQQVLAAAGVTLFLLIARRHLGTRRALIATTLFLFAPYRLYYSTWLLATTLFTALVLLTWLAWDRALRSRRVADFIVLGLLCGTTVLVRPLALLLPVVLLMGIAAAAMIDLRRSVRRHRRDWALPAALGLAFSSAVIPGAWCARNLHVAGQFALTHQSGIVMAYFKATEVMLWRQGRSADRYIETSLNPDFADRPHSAWEEIDRRLRRRLSFLPEETLESLSWRNLAQGNRTGVNDFVVSDALWDIGREELLAHPWSTLTCYLTRAGELLTFPLGLAIRPATGNAAGRLRYAAVSAPFAILVIVIVVQMLRGRWSGSAVYFPLAVTCALLAGTVPQLDPRFRVPLLPMLLIVAMFDADRRSLHRSSVDRPTGESAGGELPAPVPSPDGP
ncbi:MAG: glycosyltransferase family 39 protein [Phycisphaerae bacterium]|nr:glycosyltransferase family 39 protein [Phycisphaerae bacterium]